MASVSKISVAACLALTACAPTSSAPPSLRIVPPSYYHSYVLPRQPVQKGKSQQPQIVVIERTSEPTPAALYPPTKNDEADRRIEAVQKEVDRALKRAKQRDESP